MKCSLGISTFLKRSLVFPTLLFASISLHWSPRKAFLCFLATLWNSAFRWMFLSFSPLSLARLLFQPFARPPQTTFCLFCISFSWGWSRSLSLVQSHEPLSLVLHALCLPDIICWIYLSLSLYNHEIWFQSCLNGLVVFPTFFNLIWILQ